MLHTSNKNIQIKKNISRKYHDKIGGKYIYGSNGLHCGIQLMYYVSYFCHANCCNLGAIYLPCGLGCCKANAFKLKILIYDCQLEFVHKKITH